MIITVDQLVSANACEKQLKLFTDLFGKEVEVTEDLCVIHAMDFAWNWAASKLMPNKYDAYLDDIKAKQMEFGKRSEAVWGEYETLKAKTFFKYYNQE